MPKFKLQNITPKILDLLTKSTPQTSKKKTHLTNKLESKKNIIKKDSMTIKSSGSKISAKDAWSSTLFEKLDKINQTTNITENRSDMIHKISILDESLNVNY